MSQRISKAIAGATIAALGLITNITASAAEGPGAYVGIGVGQANNKADEISFDASDTAFKVFAGLNINKYFAIELTYVDAGAPNQNFGTANVEIEASGYIVSAIAKIPVGDSFSLFGKLGYAFYDSKATLRQGNASASSKDGNDDAAYGVGASYDFGKHFGLRAEYEGVNVSDGSFDMVSLSGVYRF